MKLKTIENRFLSENKRIRKSILGNNLVFIQSPTGTGKTTFLSNLNLKNTLYISVNRTNCSQIYISFKNRNIILKPYIPIENQKNPQSSIVYTDLFFKDLKAESVIINSLSLHRVKDNLKWDNIVIDEVSSLVGSIVEPIYTINPINHMKAINKLIVLLKKAKLIIGLDGYITKDTIKLFEKLLKLKAYFIKNNFKVNKSAKLIKVNSTTSSKFFKPETESTKFFFSRFNYACSHGSKFLCSSTTKKIIDDLYSFIISNYGNLLLEGKAVSLTPENIKFYEDRGLFINDLTKNPILLLYSPVVVTALDIQNFENEEVFHIINRNHLSSVSNYQMINRARNTKRVVVFLPEISFKKVKLKSFNNIILEVFKYKNTILNNTDHKNKKYKNKFFTYFNNLGKYLMYLGGEHYLNFERSLRNDKLKVKKELRGLILFAYYHYKSVNSDCKNSVARNLIKLLKEEGYDLEQVDETVKHSRVKMYRNNLQFKIENHFNFTGLKSHNSETLAIVKLCQYLYLNNLYQNLYLNDISKYNTTYKLLLEYNLPKFCKTAFLSARGKPITTEGFIRNKINKIRTVFYNGKDINLDLIESVRSLTPYQSKLYK